MPLLPVNSLSIREDVFAETMGKELASSTGRAPMRLFLPKSTEPVAFLVISDQQGRVSEVVEIGRRRNLRVN